VKELLPVEAIERKIYLMRGNKVMLSSDLAELYGVETRALNQAVKRNIQRFPEDFMFRLNASEAEQLVSQNVIPHKKYFGGSLPYAFTEQGVAMLSSILKSEQAIKINIAIMRAFVKLRELLSTNKELAHKLTTLERKIERHDEEIKAIFNAIRQLMTSPEKPRRKIGFKREAEKG
jgi:phage regulator Rha-like protein